ncbi:hypothetical protein GIB67_032420 [Kingdonia uniflora]|uniref:Uncharacterized protein n=1 Tax=Kingdonia uniflora TaxID=39325 RepID=A0A7J7MJB1_9MAGN|nr:hypothetical protein GIB67_032420 [Kingdonia uniflora]
MVVQAQFEYIERKTPASSWVMRTCSPTQGLREAYAMILHSAHVYVSGAIAAAQSIRMVGSTKDLVILVDDTINNLFTDASKIEASYDILQKISWLFEQATYKSQFK